MGYCPYFCVKCGDEKDNGFNVSLMSGKLIWTHDYYDQCIKFTEGSRDYSIKTICNKCLPKKYYDELNDEYFKKYIFEIEQEAKKLSEGKKKLANFGKVKTEEQMENERMRIKIKRDFMFDIKLVKEKITVEEFTNISKRELYERILRRVQRRAINYMKKYDFIFSKDEDTENYRVKRIIEKESLRIFTTQYNLIISNSEN